jgi:hypothetical protein
MFDTLSSQYDVYSTIYFIYLSNNLVQRCIQKRHTVAYTFDLFYDTNLRCNGIECTISLVDSCSDKYWYLSETLNENGKIAERLLNPYFSTCFPYYYYGWRDNYFYDDSKNLIALKSFDKDSLDNWNIYISTYYKYNSLQINNINRQLFSVFPNPANNNLTIKNENVPIKDVCLYNLMGQKVKQVFINSNETTLDVSALPAGMYIAKIKTEEGMLTRKVQILR